MSQKRTYIRVGEFRPLFNEVWEGYSDEVKKVAWKACFRRTKALKTGILSGNAVRIYRILRNLKPPHSSQ